MLKFGKAPTYQGTEKVEVAISEDRRAITLAFNGFETRAAAGSSVPVASRLFNFAIPLEGDEKEAEIEFSANGQIVNISGATSTVVLSVNGQTVALDRSTDSDDSYQQAFTFKAKRPSECRLSVVLLTGRDTTNPDSESFVGATSIDMEILPRPPQPRG